eukprot:4401771-Amphidinium_carterae.1
MSMMPWRIRTSHPSCSHSAVQPQKHNAKRWSQWYCLTCELWVHCMQLHANQVGAQGKSL